MQIAALINPHAGRASDAAVAAELEPLAAAEPRLRLFPSERRDELRDLLARALAWRPDVLALAGGDGTLHVTLTELVGLVGEHAALPALLPLPAGTMNAVARNLGITEAPATVLRAALAADRPPAEREMHVLRISDRADGRRSYGFMFACGFLFNALDHYYALGGGLRVAVSTAWTCISGLFVTGPETEHLLAPVRARVVRDGEAWPHPTVNFVLASMVANPALFFSPFARDGLAAGQFHALVSSMDHKEMFLRALPLSFGLLAATDVHDNRPCRRLELDFPRGYTVDGEMHRAESASLVIEAGPVVRMIVPA